MMQKTARTKLEFVTIGVYGFDAESFFRALQDARVDTLCDIRQRRNVRGSSYAFANRQRLQARLETLGIRYIHRKDLAPSRELREVQRRTDASMQVAKRARTMLTDAFTEGYRQECLDSFNSAQFVADLGGEAQIVALFCVEREPSACHRFLLAERLAQELEVEVTHIVP